MGHMGVEQAEHLQAQKLLGPKTRPVMVSVAEAPEAHCCIRRCCTGMSLHLSIALTLQLLRTPVRTLQLYTLLEACTILMFPEQGLSAYGQEQKELQMVAGCLMLRDLLGHADLMQACRLLVPS